MRRIIRLILPLAALCLAACTTEPYIAPVRPEQGEEEVPPVPEEYTKVLSLEAVIEGALMETRSSIAADGRISWSEGDTIGVLTDKGRLVRFGLNSTPGLTKGMFKGTLDKDESPSGTAFYPFGGDVQVKGSTVTFEMPSLSAGQIPMVAKSPAEGPMTFGILAGAVCLSIQEIPSGAKALVLEADAPIAGVYICNVSSAVPSMTFKEGGKNSVSATVPDGQHEFIFPVPAGSYSLLYWFSDGNAEIPDTREELGIMDIVRGSMLVCGSGEVHYTDLYVTPSGSGRGKGISWDNAMSLSGLEAILTGQVSDRNIAKYAGATFHFAGGNYQAGASLNFDFTKSAAPVDIHFVGGYNPASVGDDLSQRNPGQYPTVINGGASETGRFARFDQRAHILIEDMAFDGFSSGISAFYMWTGSEVKDIDVTFRGCSFSGNATDAVTNGLKYGGVFFVRAGLLKLESCRFSANSSERGGDIAVLGPGAVQVIGTEETPCVFSGSSADTGGSVYMENLTSESSFTHVGFEGCSAVKAGNTWAAGGAVSLMRNSADGEMVVSFTDCSFKGNSAPAACGGAIGLYNAEQKTLRLTHCGFDGNTALSRGGAFYTDSGANGKDAYYMTDCTFMGNSVSGTESGQGYGGAFDLQSNFKGTMYLDHCVFEGNSASVSGGAWCNYNSGMSCRTFFNACKFTGNTVAGGAENAGVLHICTGYVGMHNCAVYGNDANKVDLKISGAATALLSNTTFVTVGSSNNANPICNQSGSSMRLNLVNCILKTPGYAINTRKKGNDASSYTAGSNIDHSVVIGLASGYYNSNKTDCVLFAHSDTWDARFTYGGQKTYQYSGTMVDFTGFTAMTSGTQSYISALGTDNDSDFAAWIGSLGAWDRDIDGALRSGARTPGCVQR